MSLNFDLGDPALDPFACLEGSDNASLQQVANLMVRYCDTPGVAQAMMDALIRETEIKVSLVQKLSMVSLALSASPHSTDICEGSPPDPVDTAQPFETFEGCNPLSGDTGLTSLLAEVLETSDLREATHHDHQYVGQNTLPVSEDTSVPW